MENKNWKLLKWIKYKFYDRSTFLCEIFFICSIFNNDYYVLVYEQLNIDKNYRECL